MANKRTTQMIIEKQKMKKFQLAIKNLKWFTLLGFILNIITLFTFFINWSSVYNTTISGNEVTVNGFQYFLACISGDFKNPSYGDIAIPFYYYAKDITETLGIFTVISVFLLIISIISALFVFIRKKTILNVIPSVLSILTGAFTIVCFALALSMSGTKILSTYCGGNPACSIRSYAIVPAIFCLFAGGIYAITAIKYYLAKLEFKPYSNEKKI